MLLSRRPDDSLLIETTWESFRTEWQKSDHAHRVVLDDKRPGVLRDTAEGPPNVFTLHPHVWERMKSRIQEAMQGAPPPKRVRLCRACRAPMKVAREYEDVWCFRCEVCGGTDIEGKDRVGGSIGGGEKEKL